MGNKDFISSEDDLGCLSHSPLPPLSTCQDAGCRSHCCPRHPRCTGPRGAAHDHLQQPVRPRHGTQLRSPPLRQHSRAPLQPQLITGGRVVSNGSAHTSAGAFSGIAYLQTGACLFNGEGCALLETTLIDPGCPGCGSSTDISLIAPHALNVPVCTFFSPCSTARPDDGHADRVRVHVWHVCGPRHGVHDALLYERVLCADGQPGAGAVRGCGRRPRDHVLPGRRGFGFGFVGVSRLRVHHSGACVFDSGACILRTGHSDRVQDRHCV
jgi:hypothetical protein